MRKVEPVNVAGGVHYRVRFRWGRSDKTGKPSQSSATFPTRKEAQRFSALLDAVGPQEALDLTEGQEQRTQVPTLDSVASDHIRYMTGITDGYRLWCTRLWGRTWGPLIGHVQAHRITRDLVSDATNQLATHYGGKSLRNQRGLLSPILDRAVEHGYLTKNPTKKLRLPPGKPANADPDAPDEDMVLLDVAEFDTLLDEMHPHYKAVVQYLAGTGCRWGEMVALRKRDVSLDAEPWPFVRIRRALKDSPDGKRVIGEPKTPQSRRTITLPPELVPTLRPLLAGKTGNDLVFTAPRGGMVAHRTFWSDVWRPAVFRAQQCAEHLEPDCKCGTAHPKRCKIHQGKVPEPCGCEGTLPTGPRIHDLRHTHASWLLAAGLRIEVVSARLGHKSVKTTWDIYHHLQPDAQIDAARAASLAFRRTPPELEQ